MAERERGRWIKVERARVLAEATGRGLGSIRQLRWEDVDLDHKQIRWRADADKKGRESVVPIPAELADALRVFRRRLGAVGGWVFAAERLADQPTDRHVFNKWLTVAERHAQLPKLNGGWGTPSRPDWRTEARQLSPPYRAAAAGERAT